LKEKYKGWVSTSQKVLEGTQGKGNSEGEWNKAKKETFKEKGEQRAGGWCFKIQG